MHSDPSVAPAGEGTLEDKLSRGNVFAVGCPARAVLTNVTSRWGVLVLIALRGGTLRYSQIRRKIGGVSEKMLAQTLQSLEADGFVRRVSMPVVPPHVEYSLTPMGEEISQLVQGLTDWIETNLAGVFAARAAAAA